ncbi:unnamed protein product [Ilex paraguariensis]|uniref:Uncharacterized protein n=1 Tax=Ilex paraguariensis TaxID=185542 RepID=A0ABC8UFV2_9AQUA
METTVGIEGKDEAKFEESVVKTSSAPSSSPKHIADPVVYKLVRVQGNGRLVPATDDEVMEVADLLEDDKGDTGQTVGCTSLDGLPSSKTQLNHIEGLLLSENLEVDAEKSNALLDTTVDLRKSDAQLEEIVPSSVLGSEDSYITQSGSVGQCSEPPIGSVESGTSTSAVSNTLKPDFSKLKGEICLDKMSVKELHETFKATFGRETSVKDKQWLKRRIAMGLSNSCDVSTTTFVIEDNGVVKKGKQESLKNVDSTLADYDVVGAVSEYCRGSPSGQNDQIENPLPLPAKRLRNPSLEHNCTNEDVPMEHRAEKRVRKPTRRYIEELSEVESREYGGKLIYPFKTTECDQSSPRTRARPLLNVQSDGRSLVTRQDSLGGSGVQVPFVCRVRRSRPRENFMALMFQKVQPSGMGMTAKLVKRAIGVCGPQLDNERGNKVGNARLPPGWTQQPHIAEIEKEKQNLKREAIELDKDLELKHVDSSGDNSDDNIVTVPTANGGMRRKHHRPWTLGEVVKLVEGVARYGAGRWSEIKRVAFASYSYRTSVDLKDKWRNLLKASFVHLPAEKGVSNTLLCLCLCLWFTPQVFVRLWM